MFHLGQSLSYFYMNMYGVDLLERGMENFVSLLIFLSPRVILFCGQVILDLLNRIGALSDDKVKIIFIDTFHLFPETHQFLSELEVNILTFIL